VAGDPTYTWNDPQTVVYRYRLGSAGSFEKSALWDGHYGCLLMQTLIAALQASVVNAFVQSDRDVWLRVLGLEWLHSVI